jgi:hypothetical protein
MDKIKPGTLKIIIKKTESVPTRDNYRPKLTLSDLREQAEDHMIMFRQGKESYCLKKLNQIKSLLDKLPSPTKASQELSRDIETFLANQTSSSYKNDGRKE